MRWKIYNPARVTTIINARGHAQIARDKATLRDEIRDAPEVGHQPKTVLVRLLRTSMRLVDDALDELQRQGRIENFRMMSERKRMDLFRCISGNAPTASTTPQCFRAAKTLAAFQATATERATKQ